MSVQVLAVRRLSTRARRTTSSLFFPLVAGQKSPAVTDTTSILTNGGIIKQASSGVYHFLPLGLRLMEKLIAIIDDEMNSIGGSKMLMSVLTSSALWKQTKRWETMGAELFRLKDRDNKDYCLGPTHEEAITDIVRQELTSSKQLPLRLYQVSVKFRDEMRPRHSLLRCKEFWMKDMYTFDSSEELARHTYDLVREAYRRIFERIELPTVEVRASSGLIGGDLSHEFQVLSTVGEDRISHCSQCGYAFSSEVADKVVTSEGVDCPQSGSRRHCPMEEKSGIEVGHTFLLGTRYSSAFNTTFTDSKNNQILCQMGCYGLGVSRILAAVVEHTVQTSPNRLKWSRGLAPYSVCIVPLNDNTKNVGEDPLFQKASHLYDILSSNGLKGEVILEDRQWLSRGRRIQQAHFIGYPHVVIIGKQTSGDQYELQTFDQKGLNSNVLSLEELQIVLKTV